MRQLDRILALAATLSPDEVNYGPSENPYTRCGTCSMFTADVGGDGANLPRPGRCSLVKVLPDPQDVCDRFEPLDLSQSPAVLSSVRSPLSKLLRLTPGDDLVRGYERGEHGRIVNVHGYRRNPGDEPFTGKLIGKAADEAIARGEARGEYGEPTGYFQTSDGKRLWGWYGAAGALIRHTDQQGQQRYLLQKRAAWVDNGGTWSVPGGAVDLKGDSTPESPEEAARRETAEEGWTLPEGTHTAEIRSATFGEGPGAWSYHTVVMDAPHRFDPLAEGKPEGVHDTSHESTGHGWFTPQEMADLPLHPHFRATAEDLGMPRGGGHHPVRMTALSRVELAVGDEFPKAIRPVKGYERFEHGKLEHVTPHGEHFKLGEHAASGKNAKTNWVSGDNPKDWNYGWRKLQAGFKEGGLGPQPRPYKLNGFFNDVQGHRHWGWYGGAGVLVSHTDEHGVKRYLLQRRASFVQEGGSYSTPGGAIDAPGGIVELPEAAALREYEEEWGKLPEGATVTGVTADHHGTPGEPGHWAYHTVEISVPKQYKPSGATASHGFEASGSKWVTPEEMSKLKLHSAFTPQAVKLGMPPPPPKEARYKEGKHIWDRNVGRGGTVTKVHPPQGFDYPTYEIKDDKDGSKTWTAEERYLSSYKKPDPNAGRKLPDDYPAGSEVTWRYKGTTAEGKVTGPSEEKDKQGWPTGYHIEMKDGTKVKVKWGDLRPKSWSTLEPHAALGPVKPAAGNGRLKVESATMPGLRMDIPAQVQGQPVLYVYEHPQHPGSVILGTGQDRFYPYSFKEKRAGPGRKSSRTALENYGNVRAKIIEDPGSSSSALGKVVAAHETAPPPRQYFRQGDRVMFDKAGTGTELSKTHSGTVVGVTATQYRVKLDSQFHKKGVTEVFVRHGDTMAAPQEAPRVKPFAPGKRVFLKSEDMDLDGAPATVQKEITPATALPGHFLYTLKTDDGDNVIARHDELEEGF